MCIERKKVEIEGNGDVRTAEREEFSPPKQVQNHMLAASPTAVRALTEAPSEEQYGRDDERCPQARLLKG